MHKVSGVYVTAVVVGAGCIAAVAYYAYRRNTRIRLPTEWTRVGTLKEMYVYPIKSCAPITMTTAHCEILGLTDFFLKDRILMVVDSKNNFISARNFPEMLHVQPTVSSTILTLNYKGVEPVSVNLLQVIGSQRQSTAFVWGDPVPVYDCGWEVSEWLSRVINRSADDFRLAYYASETARAVRSSALKLYNFTSNDNGALPDEVPYNLVNQASIDDLNQRMISSQVTTTNFRPNFVLHGAIPYDEDTWKFIKIGDNVFEVIKPCFRCVLTTIDKETGVRNIDSEPLQTLRKYRQDDNPVVRKAVGNAPRMGVQMALRSEPGGVVSVNDDVYVA